ncbi:acyl-CoA dehydrogenase family protein [Streptomyces sp. NPDC006879]|uniref:acyl-CoA dehydrogenase family protein n=1 Tax=Streptomyces sp. NPDC006879 TaxID=3364767 RepID=UPI00367D84CA
MDFQLSGDQRALRAGMRELLAARYGRDALRAAVDGGGPVVDRGLWRELGAAGFFALRLAESEGGVGLGAAEAVLVFEEAGRVLLPGPLVASHLAAGLVKGAAEGEVVVTVPEAEALVAHLSHSDALLGRPGEEVAGGPVLRPVPVRSVDPLTPLHRVAGAAPPAAYRAQGALLTAALQVGSALRTTEMAVEHAKQRQQFGKPIGAFQAVKHLCAGMLVRTELARTALYAAAVTMDPAEVAGAKLLADRAAVRGARDCLQVHGGMGFTWEADVHLHLKRAWLRAGLWLTATECEERLAADLEAAAGAG